jgi:hypothetical protein
MILLEGVCLVIDQLALVHKSAMVVQGWRRG